MTDASCPICGLGLSIGEPACPTCGFPVQLGREGLPESVEPAGSGPSEGAAASTDVPTRSRAASARTGPDPVEPLAAELATGIASRRAVGAPMDAYVGELQRAAVSQAEGRPSEAVAILRGAIEKLAEESRRSAEGRIVEVDARRATLARAGILDELQPSLDRVRREMAAGRYVLALDLLESTDGTLRQIEEESLELRSTLATTEELWAAASTAGLALVGLKERIAHLGRYLAEPTHSAEAGKAANRSAHELLTLLRGELGSAFSDELARNAEILSRYPVDDPGAQVARRLNAEAAARTHDGAYTPAAALIVQLRRTTDSLPPPSEAHEAARAREPAPAAPPPTVAVAPAPAVTKALLLEEARALAARVRALPPGSELAAQAAREIQRATELLTQRGLEEAHEVLRHLLSTLDAAARPRHASGPS